MLELAVQGLELVPLSEAELQALALAALEAEGVTEGELSLVFMADEGIAELNSRYRGVEGPTDVLSFQMDGPGGLLGDIIISPETAARNAAEAGTGLEAELRTLLVHGILHLLGHEHKDEASLRAMEEKQAGIIERAGR